MTGTENSPPNASWVTSPSEVVYFSFIFILPVGDATTPTLASPNTASTDASIIRVTVIPGINPTSFNFNVLWKISFPSANIFIFPPASTVTVTGMP